MQDYLGEENIELKDSKYKDYTPSDWAMMWIEEYGQIDGSHHKDWCLDQVQQILLGTEVIFKVASWKGGNQEERFSLAEPSEKYLRFVKDYENDGEYTWENGSPP